jgi:hypothetical protein
MSVTERIRAGAHGCDEAPQQPPQAALSRQRRAAAPLLRESALVPHATERSETWKLAVVIFDTSKWELRFVVLDSVKHTSRG